MANDKSVREQLGVDLPESPEAEPVTPAETEPEQTDRGQWLEADEWVLDKFKDPSEFVTSYKTLEEELRRRAETDKSKDDQINQLVNAVETLQAYQQQSVQQQQQPDQTQWNEQLAQAYDSDPIGTMVFLSQQAGQQAAQAAIAQYQQQYQPQLQQQQVVQGELMATSAERVLEAKYADWNEYGPKVGDLLERNPNLIGGDVLSSLDRTTEVLESIYKQVKYDDLSQQLESQNGDATRMKQQAQTVSGSAGRPGQPSAEEAQINRIIAAAKNSSYSAFRQG